MAKRKTVTIEFLVNMTNEMLKNSADDQVSARRGAMCLLEEALFITGNYNGFRYLTEGSDNNQGVSYTANGDRVDTDLTRVEYYLP
jgi:hypothetical protein